MKFQQIVEAVGAKAGESPSRWRVCLIKAGQSLNRNVYPAEMLQRSVRLFEGVRAMVRTDDQHRANAEKSVQGLVGWFENAKYENGGIFADFVVEATWLRDKMAHAWELGKRDYFGFSILADATGRYRRDASGVVKDVGDFVKVHFVDVVVDPSAGGEVVGLAEADQTNGRPAAMNLETMLRLIEAYAPDKYATIDKTNIDPKAVETIFEAVLAEARKSREAAAAPKQGAVTPPATPPAGVTKDEVAALIAEATRGVTNRFESERLFATMLAESGLPDASHARVRASVPQDKVTREVVAEAIKAEGEYLKSVGASRWSGPGSTTSVAEAIVDEADKFGAAMAGFFAGEDQKLRDGKTSQKRFFSVVEAYRAFTGEDDVSNISRMLSARISKWERYGDANGRVAEAAIASSTFAGALGDHLNVALQKEYNEGGYDAWRLIADVSFAKDFQTQYRPQLGGFSNLLAVSEGNAYQEAGTEPDDFTPTIALTKYGYTQAISIETIANDRVGVIRRMPGKMARAAKRTLQAAVFAPLIANSNWYDSAAIFAAAGGRVNLTTSALTATSLVTARNMMMKQTEPQSGARLMIPPRYLMVPLDLEQTAYELCFTPSKPLISNASAGTPTDNPALKSIIESWKLIPVVIPHATNTGDWWLAADKADLGVMEVVFFGNSEEPELFIQDMPNVGSVFTKDQITYKIRQIYGVVVLDFRGLYMSDV